jgi:tRNA U55 pseudouridine synthase TruB
VRDLGEKLGTGACLVALCRTRIGNYHLQQARNIDSFE